MSRQEAEVVAALKRHLLRKGIDGRVPESILVDADPSFLRSSWRRELEPTAQVFVGGGRPDLLCSLSTEAGPMLCGFEVKASLRNLHQGMTQASRYRAGVHRSCLALPGDPRRIEREGGEFATRNGVGLLAMLDRSEWVEVLPAPWPTPRPDESLAALRALEAVPLARQLQLNHPLNFLVVALVAAHLPPGSALPEELARRFNDLRTPDSRKAAITGAQSLRLLRRDLTLTLEGRSVADLLQSLGYSIDQPTDKRKRLLAVNPSAAAVARMVLLQQPTVRLVAETLRDRPMGLSAIALAAAASAKEPMLAAALFLSDPSGRMADDLDGSAFNSSTVFKLKQNLWHAGILSTKAHPTAGKRSQVYRPHDDIWRLETVG
jgi:hypothetical protein